MKTRRNSSFILGATASAALLCSSMAGAVDITDGSLGLTGGYPDFNIADPTLSFTNTDFSIIGEWSGELVYEDSTSTTYLGDGSTPFFTLDGTVSGTSATSFTFNITDGTDTLLSGGNLLDFGYATSATDGSYFELIFGDIGGSLNDIFGDTIGIIFASNDATLGGFDFSASLNSSVGGTLDLFAVPEPGTLGIFFVGLSSLLLFGRKKPNA